MSIKPHLVKSYSSGLSLPCNADLSHPHVPSVAWCTSTWFKTFIGADNGATVLDTIKATHEIRRWLYNVNNHNGILLDGLSVAVIKVFFVAKKRCCLMSHTSSIISCRCKYNTSFSFLQIFSQLFYILVKFFTFLMYSSSSAYTLPIFCRYSCSSRSYAYRFCHRA